MQKHDYLNFLRAHPDVTVADAVKGLGVTEDAAKSALKRAVRQKLAQSSGSPPRYRLTAGGEARLRALTGTDGKVNATAAPSQASDVEPRFGRMEARLSELEAALEDDVAPDLDLLFSVTDRLLSRAESNGNPEPDAAQSSGGKLGQLLARAEKMAGGDAAPAEPGKGQQLYDALLRLDAAPWFKRRAVREEIATLEGQLDGETVGAVHRLRELEARRDSWRGSLAARIAADEGRTPPVGEEIRSVREKLGLPAEAHSPLTESANAD